MTSGKSSFLGRGLPATWGGTGSCQRAPWALVLEPTHSSPLGPTTSSLRGFCVTGCDGGQHSPASLCGPCCPMSVSLSSGEWNEITPASKTGEKRNQLGGGQRSCFWDNPKAGKWHLGAQSSEGVDQVGPRAPAFHHQQQLIACQVQVLHLPGGSSLNPHNTHFR